MNLDLKQGQQIYVCAIYDFQREYMECVFENQLSDTECLVSREEGFRKYTVVLASDIVVDDDKISKIEKYKRVEKEYNLSLELAEKLKEEKRILREELYRF